MDNLLQQVKHIFTSPKAINKEVSESEQAITHYITTPDIDEMKEIVHPEGVNMSYYENTKSVFYMHNYYIPPIGTNMWLKTKEEGIIAKTRFASTEMAKDIYQLHKEGAINNWSIGFDYDTEKEDYLTEKDGIRHINFWKLLEYSSAPFPANSNAVDIAKSLCKSPEIRTEIEKFEFKQDVLKLFTERDEKIKQLEDLIKEEKKCSQCQELKERVRNLQKLVIANIDTNLTEKQIRKLMADWVSQLTGKKIRLT